MFAVAFDLIAADADEHRPRGATAAYADIASTLRTFGVPQLVNLQNVSGKAKGYQIRQLLKLVEKHNLMLEGTEE